MTEKTSKSRQSSSSNELQGKCLPKYLIFVETKRDSVDGCDVTELLLQLFNVHWRLECILSSQRLVEESTALINYHMFVVKLHCDRPLFILLIAFRMFLAVGLRKLLRSNPRYVPLNEFSWAHLDYTIAAVTVGIRRSILPHDDKRIFFKELLSRLEDSRFPQSPSTAADGCRWLLGLPEISPEFLLEDEERAFVYSILVRYNFI